MAWTRALCTVDLAAVAHNTADVAARNPGAAVMAMVKADAYGHGMVPVAQAALAAGASHLGVAFATEALTLRSAGVLAPILVLVVNPGEELAPLVAADVAVSASAPWAVDAAAAAAVAAGRPARLHLEVDTGMTRGGARVDRFEALLTAAAKAAADGTAAVEGIWSHLVHDDPRHPFTDVQADSFRTALAAADQRGIRPELRHLAKSNAALARPDLAFDLVRPGLALYGLLDDPEQRAAMTLRARVALTGRVPAGTGVSYGHHHMTAAETGVALVPLGYGDGVPRVGGDVLEVSLGGRRRRIAGAVCMDQFTIETAEDAVHEGDEVLLFGPGDDGEPTAHEWAEATGTISYEIVTRVGARVPRDWMGR